MPRRTSKKKPVFPLLDHLDELMDRLTELTPAALNSFDVHAIHGSRVATRRFSAALDLMLPVLSKHHRKPLLKGLKSLRRRLGPLRDADVMLDHLAEFGKQKEHAIATAWLIKRSTHDRDKLREESAEGPSASKSLLRLNSWPALREEVTEARDAVDSLLAESLHLQADQFAEQADRLAASLLPTEASTEAIGVPVPPPNPHDVRIAGKALRYTLEMAETEGHSPGKKVMKSFKQMQEQLGAWHDFVVLSDTAMTKTVDEELTHLEPSTALHVLELSRAAVRQSMKELATFARLWRRDGGKIVAKIRSAFPLSKDVSSKDHGLGAPAHAGDKSNSPAESATSDGSLADSVTESEMDPDLLDSAASEAMEATRQGATPAA